MEEAITQKELEKTQPTIEHPNSETKFYYLSDQCEHSEHLTAKYNKDVSSAGINIILYLYSICDHHYVSPFLTILQEYNTKESFYDFPQITYTTDLPTEQIHDDILEKTLQKIYEIFQVKASESVDPTLFQQKDVCYKGFLEMDETNIILCMDVSPYLSHLKDNEIYLSKLFDSQSSQPSSYTWTIVDELIRHKTQNIPISPIIPNFVFSEDHEFLKYIHKDGQKIHNPKLLYNCYIPEDKDSQEFETIIPDSDDSILLLAETTEHPKIGEMIYFSESPLSSHTLEQSHLLHRFVVFVDNPIVFKGKSDAWDLSKIDLIIPSDPTTNSSEPQDMMDAFETQPTQTTQPTTTSDHKKNIKEIKTTYSSVEFKQGNHAIYGVKSPNFYCIL